MAADSPVAPSPSSASSAGCISPVEIPFRYSQGMNSSTFFVRFKYGGTCLLLNLMPPSERSRTFGTLTGTSPSPVWILRSGRYPLRTTAQLPVHGLIGILNQQLSHFRLDGLCQQLPGSFLQQFSQRVFSWCFQLDNVTLVHSGVRLLLVVDPPRPINRVLRFFRQPVHQKSAIAPASRDERYQIYALRKAGHSQKEIAEVLRRNPSTISRELGRNKGLKGYRPEQAHRLAQNRKKERDRTRIPESTWARVEQLLREDWSPEQISGWLTREEGVSVSHERIYQHVYEDKRRGGDLHRHLRCQKPRRKRYGHYDRRGQIRERVSIDERPEVVEARSRIGDWEADTVIGKLGGAVLVTLVERRSRLTLPAMESEAKAGSPR